MVLVCLSTFIFIVDPLERLIDNVRTKKISDCFSFNENFCLDSNSKWEKERFFTTCGRSHRCQSSCKSSFSTSRTQMLFSAVLTRSWRSLRLDRTFISKCWLGYFDDFSYFLLTHREILENKNATFHENGTLSFVPVRYSIPMPERSVGDPHKDIVMAANLPLLGLSSAAAGISAFAALAVSTLATSTKAQPILNLTVHDFLWGYKDNLVTLANNILPGYITFDRFGLMDRVSNLQCVKSDRSKFNFQRF